MPSTLKVRVVQARDLPIMDKQHESTDAYVQVKFGDEPTQQTDIVFRSLHPVFNADFRIEIADDIELQDHPIVFKVWDKDTYSSDDSIGTVIVDLNPLLIPDGPTKLSGWFPIYDTLRGVRGRLFVVIKLNFFHDMNPFKESSAGVPIYGLSFPRRQCVHGIHGFVEELVVERDTEYEWTDMFRTSRKSNEARQLLLYRLSSKIRRNVGRKSLEKGGQAVLGYSEAFDLESSSGALIARGFGTSCTVHKIENRQQAARSVPSSPIITRTSQAQVSQLVLTPSAVPPISDRLGESASEAVGKPLSILSAVAQGNRFGAKHQSVPPPISLPDDTVSSPHHSTAVEVPARLSKAERRRLIRTDEVQLLTLVQLPSDVHIRLGGIVVARSIKHLGSSSADQATRDAWWSELREEIQGHARALNCTSVIGYTETTTIFEDIVVLSACGTAAICGRLRSCGLEHHSSEAGPSHPVISVPTSPIHTSLRDSPLPHSPKLGNASPVPQQLFAKHDSPANHAQQSHTKSSRHSRPFACSICHIPYTRESAPFRVSLSTCQICKKKLVPELLLATIEPPQNMPIAGAGIYIEARVCRAKRRSTGSGVASGEAQASLISEAIPFLEYELHRQLLYKLRVLGMNAAFRLQLQLTIGAQLIVGVASATAVLLPALAPPAPLKIARHIETKDKEDESYNTLQRSIVAASESNCEAMQTRIEHWRDQQHHQLNSSTSRRQGSSMTLFGGRNTASSLSALKMSPVRRNSVDSISSTSSESSDSDSSNSSHETDFAKQTFVLHIDDDLDEDVMASILDPRPPANILLCTTDTPPGISRPPSNVQLLTCLRRVQLPMPLAATRLNQTFASMFHDLQAQMCFRVRHFAPCSLSGLRVTVAQPSESTVELVCTASLGIFDVNRCDEVRSFIAEQQESTIPFLLPPMVSPSLAMRPASSVPSGRVGSSPNAASVVNSDTDVPLFGDDELDAVDPEYVEITPLAHIPMSSVEQYLGRLQLHLIKESWTYRDEGGLDAFAHKFIAEAHAIARAHVASRGGNTLLSFRLHECRFVEVSKTQAYSIISLSGDSVRISRQGAALAGHQKLNGSSMTMVSHEAL